jgi:DoxX-like family
MSQLAMRRTGLALTALVTLFLLMDAAMKLVPLPVVLETMGQLGWPADAAVARLLGVITLISLALYLWPRTSVLGEILLTAYLGGAVATHTRIGSPLLSHILFGVYVGVLVWAGLWLRNPALRALIPLSSGRSAAGVEGIMP